MKILSEELEQLKKLYKKHYGKVISDEEAIEIGQRLLTVFSIISQPDRK